MKRLFLISISALAGAANWYMTEGNGRPGESAPRELPHAEQAGLDTQTLMQAIRDTRPLSVLMAEQVQALREWALPRTVPAD